MTIGAMKSWSWSDPIEIGATEPPMLKDGGFFHPSWLIGPPSSAFDDDRQLRFALFVGVFMRLSVESVCCHFGSGVGAAAGQWPLARTLPISQ